MLKIGATHKVLHRQSLLYLLVCVPVCLSNIFLEILLMWWMISFTPSFLGNSLVIINRCTKKDITKFQVDFSVIDKYISPTPSFVMIFFFTPLFLAWSSRVKIETPPFSYLILQTLFLFLVPLLLQSIFIAQNLSTINKYP